MNLVVFFTFGVSLKTWAESGMLQREIKLYHELMRKYDLNVTLITYGDSSDRKWEDEIGGIKLLPVYEQIRKPSSSFITLLKTLFIPWIICNELQRADVFKTNQIWGGWIAIIAKLLHKKPVVVRCGYEKYYNISELNSQTHEQLTNFSLYNKYKRYVYKKVTWLISFFCYRFANKIIITSKFQKEYIEKTFFIDKSKIEVIYNFIDTELFNVKMRHVERKDLLFIGDLNPRKNIIALLDAVSMTNYHINIIGKGKLKNDIINYINEKNIDAKLIGVIQNDHLPEILNHHTALVLPSHFEGNSKVCLEAMACGTCVICTDIPPNKEKIKKGTSGMLCSTDPYSIMNSIEKIMKNENVKNKLMINARRFIDKNCSLKKVAIKENTLYREIISNDK